MTSLLTNLFKTDLETKVKKALSDLDKTGSLKLKSGDITHFIDKTPDGKYTIDYYDAKDITDRGTIPSEIDISGIENFVRQYYS